MGKTPAVMARISTALINRSLRLQGLRSEYFADRLGGPSFALPKQPGNSAVYLPVLEKICGKGPIDKKTFHDLVVTGQGLESFDQMVKEGVSWFCPEKANW